MNPLQGGSINLQGSSVPIQGAPLPSLPQIGNAPVNPQPAAQAQPQAPIMPPHVHQIMNHAMSLPIGTPDRSSLLNIGLNMSQPYAQAGAQIPITVQAPDGKSYGFPTQQAADQFSSTFQPQSQQPQEQQQPAQPPEHGILAGILSSIASPFLRLGATANALGSSKYLGGTGTDNSTVDTPIGNVKPITNLQDTAGVAAQLASFAVPVSEGAGILGKVGYGSLMGATNSFGGALQQNNPTAGSIAGQTALGALGGGATAGALGAISPVLGKLAPRLLSYTSDTPLEPLQRFFNEPALMGGAQKEVTSTGLQGVQNKVLGSVKSLGTIMSNDYTEGIQSVMDAFPNKKIGFDINESMQLQDVLAKYPTIQKALPANLQSFNAAEGFNLLKAFNNIYNKISVSDTLGGETADALRSTLRDGIINSYGGEGGMAQQVLDNYSAKSTVFAALAKKTGLDNLDRFGSPYNFNSQTSATNALKTVYENNPSSYLDALKDLENTTGVDLTSSLAALTTQKTIPEFSGSITNPKNLIRFALSPLFGPRSSAFELRSLGRIANLAQSTGTQNVFKYLTLASLMGIQNPPLPSQSTNSVSDGINNPESQSTYPGDQGNTQ